MASNLVWFLLTSSPVMLPPLRTRVGFSTPKQWHPLSALVRWITRSKASHTWLVYHDHDFEAEYVLEASGPGFRIIPYASFARQNKIVTVLEPKTNIDLGLCMMAKWLGSHYDFAGLLGAAWTMLGRWLKRRWHNPLGNSHSLFCSEAVVRTLQAAKYPGAESLNPEAMSPQDLLEFLTGTGK